MNILYYCAEYHRAFGPSTHAREFFAGLQEIPDVGKCKVVPGAADNEAVRHVPVAAAEASLKRKIIRIIIPRWVRLLVLFLRPKKAAWEVIVQELKTGEWDALVMRPDWATMWAPRLKKQFPDVQFVLEINSAMFDELLDVPFKWFWKRIEARAINAADGVTAVSKNLKDYLVQYGVEGEKIHVNPNGVNLEAFNPARFDIVDKAGIRNTLGVSRDTLLFGYVGGMQKFRRLPEMVQYFGELVLSNNLNATLLLIGDGADMETVKAVRARFPHHVQQRLIITGAKPYDEIPLITSAFDVAIFPYSNPYGSPQKLFEYMAMGVPVIGPKVPVVEETFQDGLHLLLAEQDDGDSFKQLVQKCITDAGTLGGITEAAMDYVMNNYTWQKNAERVFAMLSNHT